MAPAFPLACGLLLLLGASPLLAQGPKPSPGAGDEFFETEVRPLLVEKCVECHGDAKPKGGLKLTSRATLLKGGDNGPAIVPGKPDESLLIKAVRYGGDLQMPPKGKLTAKQIEALEKWVTLGAPWPGAADVPAKPDGGFAITQKQRLFWAFQPVKTAAPPAVRDTKWPLNSTDKFILSRLEAKGIPPAAAADKRTLLRRATFDLIGLPPTPAEIDAFLADETPQAFAKVVDRLLASPLYGERWGRHWLDVVRYADARDLIQLPPESDFRESWRYRDWVVDSFNKDLSYAEFVRHQVAGDLLPPGKPGGINKDGLVATGLLAIADFVPGDVDKNQMIADYVNDQVDVVSRAFLGMSVACARCHDHKFDPISTEDYYALAGIFFSTRIIPGPTPGNTPLVRVPLLSSAEIAQAQAKAAEVSKRRAELERTVPGAIDREYRAHLTTTLTTQSAEYLVAAAEYRKQLAGGDTPATATKPKGLNADLLGDFVTLLTRIEKQADAPLALREIASGKLSRTELRKAADGIQTAFAERARSEAATPLDRASIHTFRADDPRISTDKAGKVTLWPNRARTASDVAPPTPKDAPLKTTAKIGANTKSVLRFDGQSLLSVPGTVPPAGCLFLVFQTSGQAKAAGRLLGWEDSDTGKHGLGLLTDPNGKFHAVLRQNGKSGDRVDATKPTGFETVCITWGPDGTTLKRNGVAAAPGKGVDGLSSDPAITALKIGGPGSGGSPRFTGDLAEIRIYDRPLDAAENKQVEAELQARWFQPDDPKKPASDPFADLYDDLRSARGPFWTTAEVRAKRLPAEVRTKLAALEAELKALRAQPPVDTTIPKAVVAQDGGPKDTRHEGFKDSAVFIRGDHKRLGKVVPRGFPKILTTDGEKKIADGSGRLQLADWLTRPENPLPARVMVNRIWQYHFGEGLVRTPSDFGERGERPTHPELLDHLAAKFVESGWSVKAMHRLIMLSATYQQGSKGSADGVAKDPENLLVGRANRQLLEAEAIRDSLLAVSGRLDAARGGAPFTDVAVPRRTIYLMSARTGANQSGEKRNLVSQFARVVGPSLRAAQRSGLRRVGPATAPVAPTYAG